MQAVNTYTEYPSRIGTEMPDKNTCYMLSEAENRMQQILHVTPAQMRFVAERIREHIDDTVSKQPRAKGECPEDIDERRGGIEVIGHGLTRASSSTPRVGTAPTRATRRTYGATG